MCDWVRSQIERVIEHELKSQRTTEEQTKIIDGSVAHFYEMIFIFESHNIRRKSLYKKSFESTLKVIQISLLAEYNGIFSRKKFGYSKWSRMAMNPLKFSNLFCIFIHKSECFGCAFVPSLIEIGTSPTSLHCIICFIPNWFARLYELVTIMCQQWCALEWHNEFRILNQLTSDFCKSRIQNWNKSNVLIGFC